MRQLVVAVVAIGMVSACTKASDDRSTSKTSKSKPVANEGQAGKPTAPAGKPTHTAKPRPTQSKPAKVKLPPLPWLQTEKAGFAAAKKSRKGVMIDFSAAWCWPCKELEKAFSTPNVRTPLLAKFVLVKFDVTKDTDIDEARMAKYKVKQLPAVIFLNAKGKELGRISTLLKRPALVALIAKLKVK